jgi:hypothetical protein
MYNSRVYKNKTSANVKSWVSTILICLLDTKEIIHYGFIPPKQSTKQLNVYNSIFITPHQRRRRPNLLPKNFILHHINAPSHKAVLVS